VSVLLTCPFFACVAYSNIKHEFLSDPDFSLSLMLRYWIVKSWYLLIFILNLFFKRETTFKTLLVKVLANMPATASFIDVAAHNVPNAFAVADDSAVTDVGVP
jgi:hypothetical protein